MPNKTNYSKSFKKIIYLNFRKINVKVFEINGQKQALKRISSRIKISISLKIIGQVLLHTKIVCGNKVEKI